jgi:hypothetical protein
VLHHHVFLLLSGRRPDYSPRGAVTWFLHEEPRRSLSYW